MSRSSLVVGLDIGTTKVCAVVCEVTNQGVNVLGVGTHPNQGLRKGVVNNIESTSNAIEQAVAQAEEDAGCDIHSVIVGVTGWQVRSLMSHGVAALRENKVGKLDFERVMEAAGAVVIPSDREVLHVLPCEYVVDGQSQKEPLGKPGIRFEVNCHVVTCVTASVNNILECCQNNGLHVEEVVFEPLASAQAVLTNLEKEKGAALLDIGGGTSDLVIFHQGTVVHSAVIPLGGGHVTNDIAQVLKVPVHPTAQRLKHKYGLALAELAEDIEIELETPEVREIRYTTQDLLAQIIENRVEEMLRLVRAEIENAGCENLIDGGFVLTGGCSLLKGIDRLAERVFSVPVRIGCPTGVVGKQEQVKGPRQATGVGLVLYSVYGAPLEGHVPGREQSRIDSVVSRMKRWIANIR